MKIVLDANMLYGNWYLDGPDFRVIQRHMALRGSELIIPEIVVLETVNNHRKELSKLSGAVRKFASLVRKTAESFTAPEVDDASEAYREALSARLRELCAKTPTHTDVPHDAIVERALKARRPFRESGKGYRDCLIWEIILRHVASSEDTTCLVSADKDYFGRDGAEVGLHTDLRSDLAEAGLPEDCVKLYTSLRDLRQELIVAIRDAEVDEIARALRDGTHVGFHLAEWLGDNCSGLAVKCRASLETTDYLAAGLEFPWVRKVEPPEPESISVDNVVRIDDERVVVYATADAEVTIDGQMERVDYRSWDENWPLVIVDPDMTVHHMFAQLNVTLPLRVTLTLNLTTNEVEDYEVDPLGNIFGWCQRCGTPRLSDAAEACSHCGKAFF